MSIEVTIFADASPAAVAAFAAIAEFDGHRHRFPPRTPEVLTPPMGLIAVGHADRHCLDLAEMGQPELQRRLPIDAPAHGGIPDEVWGRHYDRSSQRSYVRGFYPPPSLQAMGALRKLAADTRAHVWVFCDHERGDDPYDQWAWLFTPARGGDPAHEIVFAYGGDAGHIDWQRDLIGPDPWQVFDDNPGGTPRSRVARHLQLRGRGEFAYLPNVCGRFSPHARYLY